MIVKQGGAIEMPSSTWPPGRGDRFDLLLCFEGGQYEPDKRRQAAGYRQEDAEREEQPLRHHISRCIRRVPTVRT